MILARISQIAPLPPPPFSSKTDHVATTTRTGASSHGGAISVGAPSSTMTLALGCTPCSPKLLTSVWQNLSIPGGVLRLNPSASCRSLCRTSSSKTAPASSSSSTPMRSRGRCASPAMIAHASRPARVCSHINHSHDFPQFRI